MTDTIAAAAFPGFEHAPDELTKYIEAFGIFTILLRNGSVVHYNPDDTNAFRYWLNRHKIIDIRTQG
ncbi:hypothetical protein A8C56_02465 [Niabella ginsenosidivorans]|uniref:Uncharacterized protein n=2 Tax=Niabella ginsenosidivorans TaxID=1176587 RepID=A0A1A9HYW6_9BACT|nr:hypothetical protein A8C56_02465 [Niabella ginsenosidivorans]